MPLTVILTLAFSAPASLLSMRLLKLSLPDSKDLEGSIIIPAVVLVPSPWLIVTIVVKGPKAVSILAKQV
jgi:hypothetical protein